MRSKGIALPVAGVVVFLICTVAPALAQLAGAQGGVSVPQGSFAAPPHEEPVAEGAQTGFWLQVLYFYPVGPVYLRSAATFASFGEKERTFTSVGTIAGFRHDLLSFVAGLEADPFSRATVRPFAHGGAGVYAYSGRAIDVRRQRGGEDIARNEFRFKWQVRFGLEIGGGAIIQLVPELVQARVAVSYTTVFTGSLKGFVGYEAGTQVFEYPYAYGGKRIEYLLIGVGLVFQLQSG